MPIILQRTTRVCRPTISVDTSHLFSKANYAGWLHSMVVGHKILLRNIARVFHKTLDSHGLIIK